MKLKEISVSKIFNIALQSIINILIVYIIILLSIGLGKTIIGVKILLNNDPMGDAFTGVVADILTLLVIIELFRNFIEYFKARRFRLNNMMDPAIIIVVRELVVGLYKNGHFTWEELLGYSVLIVSLGIVRTLAVLFSPTRNAKQKNRNENDSETNMQKSPSISVQT